MILHWAIQALVSPSVTRIADCSESKEQIPECRTLPT